MISGEVPAVVLLGAQRYNPTLGDAITELTDAQGTDVPVIRLDPLLIGSIFPIHGEDRIVVAPDQVPALLPEALKAVEDRKFETHHGVNPLAILRALFVNVRAGQVEQGGSTLTQQLVKNFFLTPERTLTRKFTELVMAVREKALWVPEQAIVPVGEKQFVYVAENGKAHMAAGQSPRNTSTV